MVIDSGVTTIGDRAFLFHEALVSITIPETVTEIGEAAFAERDDEVPATCSAEGSYDEVICCSVCGAELSRETRRIAKTDHTPGEPEQENEVPATCTEEGSYDEVVCCSVCGEELSREQKTIDKLPVTFAVTEVTVTPGPAAIGDTLTWTAPSPAV